MDEHPPEDASIDYSTWSSAQLIARVTELEQRLREKSKASLLPPTEPTTPSLDDNPRPRKKKNADEEAAAAAGASKPRQQSTRLIALKFAYLGQAYNGFEHHCGNETPLPTVEEVLWGALMKTRLIAPEAVAAGSRHAPEDVNWAGCDYSKCGRTDRGVSAFGQVISIRVRSRKPVLTPAADDDNGGDDGHVHGNFDPVADELPYITMLNKVLPEDIRILAWCPTLPADFSARFSCGERRYRYFFTNPAFAPTAERAGVYNDVHGGKSREGWLDIELMRKAARYFVGVHDFRNFCRVDGSKQIANFTREIYHADVEEWNAHAGPNPYVLLPPFESPALAGVAPTRDHHHPSQVGVTQPADGLHQARSGVFCFTVHGSAFLWNQVRHLVAVLFLVGQRLEKPEVIKELLDVSKTPCRPKYSKAAETPLVLWDCIYPREGGDPGEDSLAWIYAGGEASAGSRRKNTNFRLPGKFSPRGLMGDLWRTWRKRKIDELLVSALIDVAAGQGWHWDDADGEKTDATPVETSGS